MKKQKKFLLSLVSLTVLITSLETQVFAYEGQKAADQYLLEDQIDFKKYPQDEEAYKIWKEQIISKLQPKVNSTMPSSISSFEASQSTSGSMSNEHIKFNYLNGYYGVSSIAGTPENPYDNNKKLLYGDGRSSYTTVRIDGVNYKFSPDTVKRYNNKIIGTKRYNDMIVSQHISIISNQDTNTDDVVEFCYTVENTTDTPHHVGIRMMFDTMLAYNDSPVFRLPLVGNVTTEMDLSGEAIPEIWQTMDSLTHPTIIAQGTLKSDKVSKPDRVRFTNWSAAAGNPWDYTIDAGSLNGDSAICLYWNEQTIKKDSVFACKTHYYLSSLSEDLRPPLAVPLSGSADDTKLEPNLLIEFNPSDIGGKGYMNLNMRLTNKGVVPIGLGDLNIKYYYTNDEGYPQSIEGHYIGGKIDNKWSIITDTTRLEIVEMDEPKQLADTYVNVIFDKDAGTLAYEEYVELNLEVYNTGWLSGDYIVENDHSYQTD